MSEAASPPAASEQPQDTFDDLGLQVGSRLQLELPASRDRARHFTTLVGYCPGETLLVRTPLVKGMPLTAVEGETVIVRPFSGVTAFAFGSAVERSCREPFPCLHLLFPASIRGSSVRGALRVQFAGEARAAAAGAAQPVTVIKLSAIGALLDAASELGAAGDRVDLSFGFRIDPGGEEITFRCAADIRNAKSAAAEEGARARLGIEFAGMDRTRRLESQSLVYQVAMQGRDSIT